MEDQKRPVGVGFFFAVGHSAVVLVVTMVVACTAQMLGRFQSFREIGATVSVSVSALFLFAIAKGKGLDDTIVQLQIIARS